MRPQDLRPAAIGSSGIREQAMNLNEDGRHRVAQLVRGDRDELLAGPDRLAEFLDQAILLHFRDGRPRPCPYRACGPRSGSGASAASMRPRPRSVRHIPAPCHPAIGFSSRPEHPGDGSNYLRRCVRLEEDGGGARPFATGSSLRAENHDDSGMPRRSGSGASALSIAGPSTTGIITSRSTVSAGVAASRCRPCSPFAAVSTRQLSSSSAAWSAHGDERLVIDDEHRRHARSGSERRSSVRRSGASPLGACLAVSKSRPW